MKNKNMAKGTIQFFTRLALLASISLLSAGQVVAQSFTTLHSFTAGTVVTPIVALPGYVIVINGDGATPYANLIGADNALYGTAGSGGNSGYGTIFRINADGTDFTVLHQFTAFPDVPPYTLTSSYTTNTDGCTPCAYLVLSGNTLYGTTFRGGTFGGGTLFKVKTDGSEFTTLYNFFSSTNDGRLPWAGLVISGNALYGTTLSGSAGTGTIFTIQTDGTGYTILHQFSPSSPYSTNTDGSSPYSGVIVSGTNLYGTTWSGGYFSYGTIYKLNTDGTGFTNLHHFSDSPVNGFRETNQEGTHSGTRLILSGNVLYGTAANGGSSGHGTVFSINTDGSDFKTLHHFSGAGTDGATPDAGLILVGRTLYGTTWGTYEANKGTVFSVNTDGTDFMTIHTFTGGDDGANPVAELVLVKNVLYGTASAGGSGNHGTVFSLPLPLRLQLKLVPAESKVVIAWPTNFVGFNLESATSLAPPVVWTPVSLAPVETDGQHTVTAPISEGHRFFRLSQQPLPFEPPNPPAPPTVVGG